MKTFEGPASGGKSYQSFAAPEDILVGRDLAGDERRRLLDAWKFELAPSAEGSDAVGPPEDLLRRANACRRLLSEDED
ncbi:MAG TPA: hypothetical protein VIF14_10640 [Alphaproteobacteria bacterium]|jgi:hypothetical protein